MGRSATRKGSVGERGNALVELALMCPWIIFMFMAIFDFGIYAYALISTANAARVAALYTSGSKETAAFSEIACWRVLEEMRPLQNVGPSAICSCSSGSCSAAGGNLTVTATYIPAGADGDPASQVTVVYTTIPVISVPFLSKNQLTITRTVEMRI